MIEILKYFDFSTSAPRFTSNPVLQRGTTIGLGNRVTIRGCSITSSFEIQNGEAYWDKDGKRNIYQTSFEALLKKLKNFQ